MQGRCKVNAAVMLHCTMRWCLEARSLSPDETCTAGNLWGDRRLKTSRNFEQASTSFSSYLLLLCPHTSENGNLGKVNWGGLTIALNSDSDIGNSSEAYWSSLNYACIIIFRKMEKIHISNGVWAMLYHGKCLDWSHTVDYSDTASWYGQATNHTTRIAPAPLHHIYLCSSNGTIYSQSGTNT